MSSTSLVRYLELFNLLIGNKKSNIGSFKELASRLDDGGFRITKDTPNLTIHDVAKNDYIAYISRGGYKKGGWFEYDVGAGIYSFGINKDYDENFKMPEGGYDDWDDYLYSPYTLNCFEGLYFYDYNSDEYKEYQRNIMGPDAKKPPKTKSIFELSLRELKDLIPYRHMLEYWAYSGRDNIYKVIGGSDRNKVYVLTYSQFMGVIKDLKIINWPLRNPMEVKE